MIEEKLAFINSLNDKSFINDECNKEVHYFRCPKCGSNHMCLNNIFKNQGNKTR